MRLISVLCVENGLIRLVLSERSEAGYVFYAENSVPFSGFDNEGFRSSEEVFEKIRSLYADTENRYGLTEDRAFVLLPGIFYNYDLVENQIRIDGGTVTEKDVQKLLSSCGKEVRGHLPVERTPIFYKSFYNPIMYDPIGEKTDSLYVTASVGYLRPAVKELFDNCAKRCLKNFEYCSFPTAVAHNAARFLPEGDKIFIVFGRGHTDIASCSGRSPIAVTSRFFGYNDVIYSVTDLLNCTDDFADGLIMQSNLNLAFTPELKYSFLGNHFPVREVNTRIIETLLYIASVIAETVNAYSGEKETPVYLTGSDICSIRGVKEIFEDQIGREIEILTSDAINLEGCKNFTLAGLCDKINRSVKPNFWEKLLAKIYRRN